MKQYKDLYQSMRMYEAYIFDIEFELIGLRLFI